MREGTSEHGDDTGYEDIQKLYFQDNLALMDDLISHHVIEPDSRQLTPQMSAQNMPSPLLKSSDDDNTLNSKQRQAMFIDYREPDSPDYEMLPPSKKASKFFMQKVDNRRISISPNMLSESNKQRINTISKKAFFKSNL